MNKVRLIQFGLFGLVVLVALTAASCKRGPGLATEDTGTTTGTQQPTDSNLSDFNAPALSQNQDVSGVPPIAGLGLPDATASKAVLDGELARATEAIKKIQADAVLKLVSMKFVNSFSDASGLSTNYYIFSSPTNPQFYYLVNVPRNGEKLKRFIMPTEDLGLPFDLLDLPFQYWKLSYIEAIKAGETQGSKEFVTAHPKFDLSMILAKPAGQYLNWFLTYRANDGSGAVLKIAVDALSGTASIVK